MGDLNQDFSNLSQDQPRFEWVLDLFKRDQDVSVITPLSPAEFSTKYAEAFDRVRESFVELLQAAERVEAQRQTARKISSPPGHFLISAAEFLFSNRTLDEILRPALEDMRCEYNGALAEKRVRKAKWIRVRGTWSFLAAASMVVVGSVGKLVVRVYRLIA